MIKEKLLVTGGLGFIGSNVVNYLQKLNYDIHVIDNLSTGSISNKSEHVKYYNFSITNKKKLGELLKKNNYECIFHLAALPRIEPSFKDVQIHHNSNVLSTLNIIENIKDKKNKPIIINSSSSSIYGDPSQIPTSENSQINPLNPYALQKYTSEKYIEILCNYHKIKFINLRYFNPYGKNSFNKKNKYSAYSSVIGIWHNCYLSNIKPVLYGDGKNKRDFINVENVAQINYLSYLKLKNNIKLPPAINVGTGKPYSLNKIIKLFGWCKNQIQIKTKRPGEARVTHADIRLLNKFFPEIKFDKIEDYIKELKNAQSE
jgi:UDP-glucose 4-epimerase